MKLSQIEEREMILDKIENINQEIKNMEKDDVELHMTSHSKKESYYKFAPINAQMKKII